MEFALYPFLFLHFWYSVGLKGLLHLMLEVNRYCSQLLSLSLLVRTFFHPLKNEYRGDLVGFSIVMGVVVKTFLISIALSALLLLFFVELGILILYISLPVIPLYLFLHRSM